MALMSYVGERTVCSGGHSDRVLCD
jgi:hypothetical protein